MGSRLVGERKRFVRLATESCHLELLCIIMAFFPFNLAMNMQWLKKCSPLLVLICHPNKLSPPDSFTFTTVVALPCVEEISQTNYNRCSSLHKLEYGQSFGLSNSSTCMQKFSLSRFACFRFEWIKTRTAWCDGTKKLKSGWVWKVEDTRRKLKTWSHRPLFSQHGLLPSRLTSSSQGQCFKGFF